jgi:hypothetical protein
LLHEILPLFVWRKIMSLGRSILLLILCGFVTMHGADTTQQATSSGDDSTIPQSVKEDDFEALFTNSPFTRSLGVSDSLILTGIAQMENEVFATLLDTRTMESHVVSKTANLRGWQLLGVGGNAAKLQTWTARIQVAGGEVISVRYQKPPPKSARIISGGGSSNTPSLKTSEMQEAKQAAVNYREGFTSDGYPKAPPPEMVDKLSRLSVGQREDINRQMIGLRNKGLGMEERRKIYESLVERSGQGRR